MKTKPTNMNRLQKNIFKYFSFCAATHKVCEPIRGEDRNLNCIETNNTSQMKTSAPSSSLTLLMDVSPLVGRKKKTQPVIGCDSLGRDANSGYDSLVRPPFVPQPIITCHNPSQPVTGENVFLDRNGIKTCNDVTPVISVTRAHMRSTHVFPHNST
jgi:hypothetical protein